MAKYWTNTLQKGSQGDEAKEWQTFLNSQGYNLVVDGDFGDLTTNATIDWQTKNGLEADGIVGEQTWGKAGYTLSPSSTDFEYEDFTYEDYDEGEDFTYKDYVAPDKFEYEKFDKGEDFSYDKFTHEDYSESENVKQAQEALNAHLASKPGEYQSQWQGKLDELMNSIMNRDKFSYNMNEDALYQQYKDKYIQQGKMAMADTMGQAAALTGGYGSSYATTAGNQAYQAQLQNLNDIVPELYRMALDKYNQEGQDLYNQYGMVADRENLDYGRYRDTVSDYLTDRDYLSGRYDSERDYDYSKYVDDRNFAYGQYADDRNLDYQKYVNDLNFRYGQYSDDRNLAYSQYESDRSFGYNQYINDRNYEYGKWADDRTFDYSKYSADRSLAYDKYSSDRALSYEEYRAAIADEQWREQMDFQKQQYEDSKVASVGSGGSGGSGGNGGNGGNGGGGGATYADTLWTATGTYDDSGNPIFRNSEGKTQAFGQGVNPYTGTKNKDCKNGTFSNGYQPNNINGTKLKNSGMSTNITGKNQTIWEANGKYWLWRGDLNKYIEVDVSELD